MLTPSEEFCNFFLWNSSVAIRGPGATFLYEDFSAFHRLFAHEKRAEFTIELQLEVEIREKIPAQKAQSIHSECVVYQTGSAEQQTRWVDYHGQAILRVEEAPGFSRALLQCPEESLRLELAYLYLHSKIGKFFDEKSLHRVHGMAFGAFGRNALVLLPSGGGKSTLALSLLQKGATLLSEDTPLVNAEGLLYPYPTRLSYREDFLLPQEWEKGTVHFKRRKYGNKKLLRLEQLEKLGLPEAAPKSFSAVKPDLLIVGQRFGHSAQARLEPASRREVFMELCKNLVLGIGLPQVIELLWQKNFWLTFYKNIPLLLRRLKSAQALVWKAECYTLFLSHNSEANADLLWEKLREVSKEKSS